MDQQQINIDYLAVLKRRIHWLIWPPLVILIGAAVMALLLPNIYKSEATILIENRQISEGLVESTVTTFADQRIQAIKQEVMSRSKILELVKKFDLFPELKEKISTNALTEKVKQSIAIKPLSTAVKTGRNQPGYITIAFNISFEGKNPGKIQQVVNSITSFFLEKNLKARQASAMGTTKFLDKQAQKSQETLSELNKKISAFKEDHLEELPEFMQLNLQKVDKISQKVNNIEQQLLALQEQAISVKYKLGFVNPYSTEGNRVLSDEERLQQLELKLMELRSKYSPKHPKVQAIEKEVEALGQTVKYGHGLDQKRTRLKELRQSLAEDLSKYSEQHPVVKRVRAEVAQLEEEIEATESDVESTGETEDEVHIRNVTNPAYINLQSEVDRIELRRTTLKEQKRELNAEENQIYAKLRTMPNIEKQYQDLRQDRDNVKRNLFELQNKLQIARVAEGMEEGQLGERFFITEPAYLPDEPFKPNRIAIILLGFILGMGGGVGLAALREYSDHSIRMPEDVQRLTGYSILSTIPRIQTRSEKRRKIVKWCSVVLVIFGLIVAGLALFHYMVMDLYIFYDKVMKLLSDRLLVHF